MVPILFFLFNFAGIEQDFIMHLALGTSFSIIIPTSIISMQISKRRPSRRTSTLGSHPVGMRMSIMSRTSKPFLLLLLLLLLLVLLLLFRLLNKLGLFPSYFAEVEMTFRNRDHI